MKHLTILLLIIWMIPYSYSQGIALGDIATAGSNKVYEDLSVTWTIGENLVDFSVMNSELNKEDHSGKLTLADGTIIKVYPTTATEQVIIFTESSDPIELNAKLVNLKGSTLKVMKLWSREEVLKLNDLSAGMYILQITNKDMQEMKTVKIIK